VPGRYGYAGTGDAIFVLSPIDTGVTCMPGRPEGICRPMFGRCLVLDKPQNLAQFVDKSVPQTEMKIGESQTVTVTMRNIGVTTWTASGGYQLGSVDTTWGPKKIPLPGDVAPGTQVTFQFNLTAPKMLGGFDFQWRMRQGDYPFGESTPKVRVFVNLSDDLAEVPEVVEGHFNSAKRMIEQAGLVAKAEPPNNTDDNYYIHRQKPVAGSIVRRGSTVTCYMKRGPVP
jgi:Ig-like domain from next to BRCA1 gene/PASTA domain